jgi:hypothetical protein
VQHLEGQVGGLHPHGLEAHHATADHPCADERLGERVGRHRGGRGHARDHIASEKIPARRVALKGPGQEDGVRRKDRDLLQDLLQGAIGQIAHLESSLERRQLLPGSGQPHTVHGRGRAVDHDDAPGRRLQAQGGLQSPGPIEGQPSARDVGVELERCGRRGIDGREDDRGPCEQLRSIAEGDAQCTAVDRDDQVDGAVRVLAPEEFAQLAVRLVALEQREIEVLGVEVHGAGQPRLQGGAHGLVEDHDGRQQPRLGVEEQDVLPGAVAGCAVGRQRR